MRKTFTIRITFLVFAMMFSPAAYAQNNRSAVSVTGSDAAACTVPDPCRTFGVAQSKTNAGGEIVALTSGGYGPFIIDKSVTVVAAPGIYAALVATDAVTAIEVNAIGAKVVIRGLHLYGMGVENTGVNVAAADEVHIENCVINGFDGNGVSASANVRISNTTIRNCVQGIAIIGSSSHKATINGVEVRDCPTGIAIQVPNATVRDSVVADCSNIGFYAAQGAQLNIENCLVTNNGVGIQTFDIPMTILPTVRVSNTMVTDNGTGLLNTPGATMISWGNNKVQGNTTNKSGTITMVTQD